LTWWAVGVVLLAAISISFWLAIKNGEHTRTPADSATGLPAVAVDRVVREPLFNQVTIPAEFRAYQEVELHAKVSGYVSQMNVDFGDHVKAGQLLATLEVPELQDQLHNAMAIQQKAEADYRAAHLNYTRLLAVVKQNPNLVAQQDVDAAEAKDGTAAAAIAAAKADVERYRTLTTYTQITAPFDGVVTRRYVDNGALIQSGTASETQSLPVVRVSDNYHLRLDFPVSVAYVKDIHLDDTIEVQVESLGMKTFKGKIKRFSMKVNEATRTMMTEIEVANPGLEIVPGMYAIVVLRVQERPQALSIPTQAVSGEKRTVYVVNAKSEIEERAVTLGLETPNRYEVISGLREGDLVMIGGRTQIQPGQKVTTVAAESLTEK
jgi:RND family efflux transporter MFP subunit